MPDLCESQISKVIKFQDVTVAEARNSCALKLWESAKALKFLSYLEFRNFSYSQIFRGVKILLSSRPSRKRAESEAGKICSAKKSGNFNDPVFFLLCS